MTWYVADGKKYHAIETCLDDNLICGYVDGCLERNHPDLYGVVERHVQSCYRCRLTTEQLREELLEEHLL